MAYSVALFAILSAMSWNPTQYLKFASERLRPALDLLARIPAVAPETVVDFGCGTGNLTPLILRRWPNARLTGVDGSREMLAKARVDYPHTSFIQADVGTWRPPQPVDVLYSNAALHWLDEHEVLIPALLAAVKPGGWLAIQMPSNFAEPTHICVIEAIEQGPCRAKLEPHLRRRPVAEPRRYWELLHDKVTALEIWETQYLQVLKGENPVAEFIIGSWLKQFLDRLQESERSVFETDYRARVRSAYPPERNGHTLFPFRRLFIVAQRAG